jgi:hypothetical protein
MRAEFITVKNQIDIAADFVPHIEIHSLVLRKSGSAPNIAFRGSQARSRRIDLAQQAGQGRVFPALRQVFDLLGKFFQVDISQAGFVGTCPGDFERRVVRFKFLNNFHAHAAFNNTAMRQNTDRSFSKVYSDQGIWRCGMMLRVISIVK